MPDANAAFSAYQQADATASAFAGIVATERYFAAACDAGEVPPLTLDQRDLADAPEDPLPRIKAVHERLTRLAYAPPPLDSKAPRPWDALKGTFAVFQREAGLAPADGELTVASWDALQQLFNFETPLHVSRWFDTATGEALPAMVRAARLRLSVLGFGRPPSAADLAPRDDAMADFAATALALGALERPLSPRLSPEFADALFAHDRLTDRLAGADARWDALSSGERAGARRLLVCVAKIELWLHGYDVRPDGNSELVTPMMHGPHGRVGVTSHGTTLAYRFAEFFRETDGERRVRPEEIPQRVPELLRRMQSLRHSDTTPDKAAASLEIVGELDARLRTEIATRGTSELWTKLKEAASQLVSTLFDGVRRVISWVGRVLKKGWDVLLQAADTFSNVVVNLWRTVYHFMGHAAFQLRKAFRAFVEGVGFFVKPGHESEPAGHCCYGRRVDFDGSLLVDLDAEDEVVATFTTQLGRKARCFTIACRIVALVVLATRTALASAAGMLGGFVPMILGLASIYSQVRQLGVLLDTLVEE